MEKNSINRWFSHITAPHPRLKDMGDRQGARLFICLLLVHTTLAVIGLFIVNALWLYEKHRSIWQDQDTHVVLIGIVSHIISLLLIRAGRYRTGVLIYVISTSAVPLIAPFVPDPNAEIGLLAVAIFPVILAAIAFSTKQVAVILFGMVSIGTLQLITSDLNDSQVITGAILLFIIAISGGLVIVFHRHLKKLEKRRIAMIREGERRYKDLFGSVTDGLLITDGKGQILEVNNVVCSMLGYTSDELRQLRTEVLFTDLTGEQVNQLRSRIKKGSDISEYNIRRKNGTRFPVELLLTPIEFDGYRGILAVARDIRERRQSEIRLQESEKRYRMLFESASDAIFIIKENRFFDCNPKTLEMFQCSREQIIEKSPYELSPEFQPDGLFSKDKALDYVSRAYHGDSQFFQWQHQRCDGVLFYTEVSLTCFNMDNETYFLAIVRDITKRIESDKQIKTMEAKLFQTQKMEAIGTLAGGVAHDFNNILSGIMGYSQLVLDDLKNTSVPEKTVEWMNRVIKASHRAGDLVTQILAFSRSGSKEPSPVRINLIAKEVCKLVSATFPSYIKIEHLLESDNCLMADPTSLHQILMNLLTNARDAIGDRDGSIFIGTHDITLDGGSESPVHNLPAGKYIQITVKDSGAGMEKETLDRILEPFFTTKPAGKGTGMGLSVVHGIVKSLKGTLKIDSAPGEGTRFDIFLPAMDDARNLEKDAERQPEKLGGTEHVLFVDDEPHLAEIMKESLEDYGYTITTFTSSLKALEAFNDPSRHYDIVISDITMPDMTGERLANEIRQIDPDIPVILCTGFSELVDEEKALKIGVDALLFKPVPADEMIKTLRNLLDKRENGPDSDH